MSCPYDPSLFILRDYRYLDISPFHTLEVESLRLSITRA